MSLKGFLENKKTGFWFTVAASIISLLAGIIYMATASGLELYARFAATQGIKSWFFILVGVLCILGFLATLVAIMFKQDLIAKYITFISTLATTMMFIYASFGYVFEFIVGIETQGETIYPLFIILFILFVVSLVLGSASIFLKQTSDEDEVKEEVKELNEQA